MSTQPAEFARVYIASRLERWFGVRRLRDALLKRGVAVTYDWTVHGSVQHLGEARIAEVAEAEARGVIDADLVVVLLPGGRGTHTELGIAIGAEVPVVLVADEAGFAGADGHICAFYHHPLVTRMGPAGLEAIVAEVLGRLGGPDDDLEDTNLHLQCLGDELVKSLADEPVEGGEDS